MTSFEHLNPKQREAVTTTDGPVLVIAGAGTGKTRVLTERIIHLLGKGIAPEHILAITFTNKAAQEMRERVMQKMVATNMLASPVSEFRWHTKESGLPFIGTFHSLGIHILRDNYKEALVAKRFTIFDRDDSKRVIKRILKELDIDPKRYAPGAILSAMSKHKGNAVDFQTFRDEIATDHYEKIVARVWERYESALLKEKALDFDDLLLRALQVLQKHSDVLTKYQTLWKYVHIDEYQDTNTVQYQLACLIAREHTNIFAVGDHDQVIYTWRGANMDNLFVFEKDFPGTQTILLEENYRSTQTILTAANQTIKANEYRKEKALFTKGAEGEQIQLYIASNETDEAHHIATTAKELIVSGVSAKEIAVLFRAHFQSRALEEAFLKHEVPYQVLGVRFFERKEVKDVLAFLHAALNPDTTTHLSRIINVPPRGIGKVTLLKILQGQEETLPARTKAKVNQFRDMLGRIATTALSKKPSETIQFIIRETGLEKMWKEGTDEEQERLENVKELATIAARYDVLPPEEGIMEFLEQATLSSDQDNLQSDASVKLMTIHAAKGLEFDHVFIGGMEEGLLPHENSVLRETPEEREEERRLFYVALTRAKKQAHLSYTSVRTIFGSPTINVPSHFLDDIDDELIKILNEEDGQGFDPTRELLTIE